VSVLDLGQLNPVMIASNGNGLSAIVACIPLAGNGAPCQDRLLVRNDATNQLLEITNDCFLPWRPLRGLVWLSEDSLQLEQWASPTYGTRYVIDLSLSAVTRFEHLRGDLP
jgi:hypothetical protein